MIMLKDKVARKVMAGPKRVEFLKNKYPEIADQIQEVADSDPTKGKQKYLQWGTNMLLKGEPSYYIQDEISRFQKIFKYLDPKDRDINKHKNVSDLGRWMRGMEIEFEDQLREDALAKTPPEKVYDSGEGTRVWEIKSHKQMCLVGKGSNWCVANPSGTYWEQYKAEQDSTFYLIEEDGDKYMAYVVARKAKEVRDWDDHEAQEKAEILYDADLVDSADFEDEEERYERMREEAWESAQEELMGWTIDRTVGKESEDYFDDFMFAAEEEEGGEYWTDAWEKYQKWADPVLREYFQSKLNDLGSWPQVKDKWGFGDWDFEWESDYGDTTYGYFVGKEEDDIYAAFLVKKFLEEEMGWTGSKNPGEDDARYEEPWDELLKQVASGILGRL